MARCATGPSLAPLPDPALSKEEKPEVEPAPGPGRLASLQLTEHARLLIEEKKPDEAIRTLERAVNLYPTNGGNYYYLAEAWLLKGNVREAGEFHGIAAMYLRGRGEWKVRLTNQREKISKASR
ncbi:MAG: hypothetical protein JW836_16700 [Deltaproteobacteria bacterium]|nr:hypothetical protein [Deltaproteobacteria bacterium]